MVARHLKLDIETGELDAVNAVGGPLVRGPRVFGQELHQGGQLFGGETRGRGGSRFQIGGPTGAFIVIVYGIVSQYGYDGLASAKPPVAPSIESA